MKKNFNPENYGMRTCPLCNSHGYIWNPKRQCCPKCGGFGFIKKEAREYKSTFNGDPLDAKHILG